MKKYKQIKLSFDKDYDKNILNKLNSLDMSKVDYIRKLVKADLEKGDK